MRQRAADEAPALNKASAPAVDRKTPGEQWNNGMTNPHVFMSQDQEYLFSRREYHVAAHRLPCHAGCSVPCARVCAGGHEKSRCKQSLHRLFDFGGQ